MFRVMAGVVALAAAGSVAWGATQGVSVGEIIHGVEHLTVAKDEHGNWSIRIDDPGDEVGFVKAMHDDAAFNQFHAAEMLQVGHTTCEWLRNGSGPNEIINWMDQKPGMAGISPVLLHKVELDLITNSQMYLCPDTLHNGTVSTPTPTTTAPPAPPEPTTMVATTAPPSTRSPQHENLPGTDAQGFVDYSAARCDPGSTPAVMQRTAQSVLVVCEIGADEAGFVSAVRDHIPTAWIPGGGTSDAQLVASGYRACQVMDRYPGNLLRAATVFYQEEGFNAIALDSGWPGAFMSYATILCNPEVE